MALADYFDIMEPTDPKYDIDVNAGLTTILSASMNKLTDPPETVFIPPALLPKEKQIPITFGHKGKGTYYYSVRLNQQNLKQ